MTYQEAKSYQQRLTAEPCSVEIVRILPESIDPIKPNDNGWDCRITYHYDDRAFED